jgi:hypothetical protein
MDAMRAGRQVVQVEGDQHAAIDRGEVHCARRLSIAGLQMRDGVRLLRGSCGQSPGQQRKRRRNAVNFGH